MMVVIGAGAWGAGCVSQEKYDQLDMSHRTLAAEKAQIEQELFDARSVTDNLRNKVTSLEGELDTKNQLVGNLQDENDHLEGAFASAQKTLEELAKKPLPDTAVVERTILPEVLDTALKRFAAQYPSAVEYDEKRGTVKWKSDLLFALGSDVVKDSAKGSLAGFAEIMSSAAAAKFDAIIVGHTDNVRIGREATRKLHPTNWHLSVHRAIAVSDVLQADGIPATRIGVMGYGEFRPLLPNEGEENRAKNRRVEIFIVPAGTVGSTVATGA
jgi:chemotaxis protein MotB